MDSETPGHRIRARRDKLGITQYELGRLVGLTEQAINRIEVGTMPIAMIDHSYLLAIAAQLGTTMEYILHADLSSDQSTREEILRIHQLGVLRSDQERKDLDKLATQVLQRNKNAVPLSRADLLTLLEMMRDPDGY